jgi:hypothetical protein
MQADIEMLVGKRRGVLCAWDRREVTRVPPERTPWPREALLRPGQEVRLVNVSAGGALLESRTRMTPGLRTELQLFGDLRRSIGGRIARCHVAALDPVRYQGAIVFDGRLEWDP